jgi:hypothetical protein
MRSTTARLVHLVVGGIQVDRLAVAAVGPQLLADAVRVVRDHALAAPRMLALER